MYFIFVGFFGVIALSIAQDPRHAAILTDARYLAGDGTFGAAYTQEDGVQFKEVSDANGDRRGSYSYVDPTGHRRTVQYTAGKNGFQPIGEGIPKVTLPTPPPPGYEPLSEYSPPEYQSQPEPHTQSQPQSPPRSYQYQTEPQYIRQSIYQPRSTPAPQSAYQPRYQNEYEAANYQLRPVHRPVLRQQRVLAPYKPPQTRPQYPSETHHHHHHYDNQPEPRYGPHIEYSFNTPSESIYHNEYHSEYNDITTPSPQKYYPPGKLDFTRTPDGFSYTFTKS